MADFVKLESHDLSEQRRRNELRDRFAFEAYQHFITFMPERGPEKMAEKCGAYADLMMRQLYPDPTYCRCTDCDRKAYLIDCISESPNVAGRFCYECYQKRQAKHG